MKNRKMFFPIFVLLFFAAGPAFADGDCPTCRENEEGKPMPALQPIEVIAPGPVASLTATPDAVIVSPGYGNGYLHPAEMLIGRVPGVWVSGSYNSYRIRIRGALGPPLLVLDDMPFYNCDDEALNNLLLSISTADIERIEVLKSLAEASRYSQAGNGVIRIVTRRGMVEDEGE